MFTVANGAAVFLKDREITVEKLLAAMDSYPEEPSEVLHKIHERSLRIAAGSNADTVTSLHLLAALVREKPSQAWQLLNECGANIGAIRASVMSYATASRPLPRRLKFFDAGDPLRVVRDEQAYQNEHPPSPIAFHPLLGVDDPQRMASQRAVEPLRQMAAPQVVSDAPPAPEPEPPAPVEETRAAPDRSHFESDAAIEEAKQTARKLAENLFAKRKEAERMAKLRRTAEIDARAKVAAALDAPSAAEAKAGAQRDDLRTTSDEPLFEPDFALAKEYELDEDTYPFLVKFGRNLTAEAAMLQIDPAIGRDAEIGQLIDILGKRRSNNPLLVGAPGVGKTAIVEGLACEFVEMARRGGRLGKRVIIELEMGRLLSGTHLRGSFSERLIGIKEEVHRAKGQVIIFLDEVHTWISAGAGGDGGDAAGELKTALARGQFPCIGATTNDEFRKFIETDSAFERRFQSVAVEEPDVETAVIIMRGVKPHYERHHGVRFSDEAVEAAVRLGHRYIHDRQLPDKAIGVLDLAGSRAARIGQTDVEREHIARVVAEIAGIPADRLLQQDRERFLHMERFLADSIVGHSQISKTIADVIRRNYAGFRSRRPIGSLLFLGPTGVGKTEMVKALADFLFHDRDAIVRLDMSEFMEAHSVSRLIGAPPGYVGYDQGGQLTEAIRRRPYQVVLLDEIEKAHPDVLNLLLQVFDEGRLTDGRARLVDFSNTVVVMTSNLGASALVENSSQPSRARIGFSEISGSGADAVHEQLSAKVLDAARRHFTPELWNRIDERLVFAPLGQDEVAQIARLQLADSSRRLAAESDISLSYDDAVIAHLIENGGWDPKLGARPMRQTIQRLIEGAVARLILEGSVQRGATVHVRVESGQLVCA